MIYVSFGMLKSASTLAYQLTEEILRQAGRRPISLGRPLRPAMSVTNYFDDIDEDLIKRVEDQAKGRDVVLKTHQRPGPGLTKLIEKGEVLASATFRDPREIALSMVDHGERSRRWAIPEFSECATVLDCCPSIDNQVETLRIWNSMGCVELIPFNTVCFDMTAVITRLAQQMGVMVNSAAVARVFAKKWMIGQFNRGVADRFHEMPSEQSTYFLRHYASFYEEFLPFPQSTQGTRSRLALTPASGQLRQIIIDLKRLCRNWLCGMNQEAGSL
jgi:hypothetical protein